MFGPMRARLYEAIDSGELPVRKVGRRAVNLAGIGAWLESLPIATDGKSK